MLAAHRWIQRPHCVWPMLTLAFCGVLALLNVGFIMFVLFVDKLFVWSFLGFYGKISVQLKLFSRGFRCGIMSLLTSIFRKLSNIFMWLIGNRPTSRVYGFGCLQQAQNLSIWVMNMSFLIWIPFKYYFGCDRLQTCTIKSFVGRSLGDQAPTRFDKRFT